uniref:Uncharacterized protein n=1 Tax=Meleagris gallopavo TaxID=9103 RepID=H9H212_MELGA
MNSYFTNPSLSCHLTSGQEVLPNVALNSTAYDPVRHFSTYGAAVAQNRIYSSPFYSPQDNVVFSSSRGPYDYGSNAFYQEKDMLSSCRQNSMGHNTQTSIAQDFTSDQNRNTSQEQKTSIQIYPWMQRMNSHSGKFYRRRKMERRTERWERKIRSVGKNKEIEEKNKERKGERRKERKREGEKERDKRGKWEMMGKMKRGNGENRGGMGETEGELGK